MVTVKGRGRARRWGFALMLAAALALHLSPLDEGPGLQLLDRQFQLLRSHLPAAASHEVAVIGIDEATLRAFPEPTALWHPHLGALLQAMAEARPAALGLDLVLPDRSYDFLLPGQDRPLLAGLLALRRAGVPLALGQTTDESGALRPLFAGIVAVAGGDSLGLVVMPVDGDRRVRRLRGRVSTESGGSLPSLAARIAERLGAEPVDGLIDYTLGSPFDYLPLHEVTTLGPQALRQRLAGKVVLVGAVLPFEDRHAVPVALAAWEPGSKVVPGVLVQAQALRTLLAGRTVRPAGEGWGMALTLAMGLLWWLGGRWRWALVAAAGAPPLLFLLGAALLHQGVHLPVAAPIAAALLAPAARLALEALFHYRDKRHLRAVFGRFVSPAVMGEIVAGRLRPGVGGETRRLCVLFADIRGFTERSEGQRPEETIALLNRYLSQMTRAIHGHGGTVDKFIGDGIMAFFGAPNALESPGRAAFAAAREMLARLEGLNRALEAEGIEPIRIGIGLHLGDAVVGNVGAESRHEYTAIGDTVNVASRLEGLTKGLGFPLVVSQAVAEASDERLVPLGEQAIKGHTPVAVFGWRPDSGGEIG